MLLHKTHTHAKHAKMYISTLIFLCCFFFFLLIFILYFVYVCANSKHQIWWCWMLMPPPLLMLHTNCSYPFHMFVHFHMRKWSFKINITFESQRQKEYHRYLRMEWIYSLFLSLGYTFTDFKKTESCTLMKTSVHHIYINYISSTHSTLV